MKQNIKSPVEANIIKAGRLGIGRLLLQFKQLEKQPYTFGPAGALTPSEIHTIDAIGCDGRLPMGELAARLGVTKGAVSQLIKRLEQKDCVQRESHPEDSRIILVSLTGIGRTAYRIHERQNAEFYARLSARLSMEEIKTFTKCIDELCEILRK